MKPLNDVELLLLADLNVAGEGGRIKTRLLTLIAGSKTSIQDSLDTLVSRGYITVINPPGCRAIRNRHIITDLGREKIVEAAKLL